MTKEIRASRNKQPNYTGINDKEEMNQAVPRVRDMSDSLDDVLPKDLVITRPKFVTAKQPFCNKFKKVISREAKWRDETLFTTQVNEKIRTDWAANTSVKKSKILFELQKYRKVFSEGLVTLRPLMNFPKHLGVYSTEDIKIDQTISGMYGLIITKSTCSDSMVAVDGKSHKWVNQRVLQYS